MASTRFSIRPPVRSSISLALVEGMKILFAQLFNCKLPNTILVLYTLPPSILILNTFFNPVIKVDSLVSDRVTDTQHPTVSFHAQLSIVSTLLPRAVASHH